MGFTYKHIPCIRNLHKNHDTIRTISTQSILIIQCFICMLLGCPISECFICKKSYYLLVVLYCMRSVRIVQCFVCRSVLLVQCLVCEVSLLCSALLKCPYCAPSALCAECSYCAVLGVRSVIMVQCFVCRSVLIVQCFVCEVSLLCSLYMQNVLKQLSRALYASVLTVQCFVL